MNSEIKSALIVPTYGCNLACPYCYAAKYRGKFPQMSWLKFRKILDKLIVAGVRKISFIGGEPTIWPHLSKAIVSAKSAGIQVGLLSNGMLFPEELPFSVMINATNLLDSKLRSTILANIKKYRQAGVFVGLRFNLGVDDTTAKIKKYVDWADKFADAVSFSPTVPYELDRRLGQVLYDFARAVLQKNKKVSLNRAVPICIFDDSQLDFLRKNCQLYSVCEPGKSSLVFNPDSTILPCVDLTFSGKIRNEVKISKKTQTKICALKNQAFREVCKSCPHFPADCQGGCLSMKNNV